MRPRRAHLERLEPFAREMFPLGEPRATPRPGSAAVPACRTCCPIIGAAPRHKRACGSNFGHQHLGLTLGPISGRLLAEMMTGEPPFVDPAPFRAERFG